MAKRSQHPVGKIRFFDEYDGYFLACGWCNETELRESLSMYLCEELNDEVRIIGINHVWLRFIPDRFDPDYAGYWHDASPHARGATKMTSAQIQW